MKKYYDKVLFLLALIVLGIGVAMFYFKEPKGGLPKPAALPPLALSGTPYATIEKPEFKQDEHTWSTPAEQRPDEYGWLYFVFTPPKIYWETGVGWTAEPPGPVEQPPVFGLHLVSAKKELYRIQLQGTSGNGDKDDVVNFSDEETGLDFHLKVGESSPLHEVEVKDLVFDQVDKGHGLAVKGAKVTILDTRSGQTVTLIQGEEYAPTDNQLYVLQTVDPLPPKEWRISKTNHDEVLTFPGSAQNFKGDITFTVQKLDFNKPSVTVEKQYTDPKTNKHKSESRELLINSNPAPESPNLSSAPAMDAPVY